MGCGPEELVGPIFVGGYSTWSVCSFVAAVSPFTESDHSGLEAAWFEFIVASASESQEIKQCKNSNNNETGQSIT
jgi:hypothetical protein